MTKQRRPFTFREIVTIVGVGLGVPLALLIGIFAFSFLSWMTTDVQVDDYTHLNTNVGVSRLVDEVVDLRWRDGSYEAEQLAPPQRTALFPVAEDYACVDDTLEVHVEAVDLTESFANMCGGDLVIIEQQGDEIVAEVIGWTEHGTPDRSGSHR